MDANELLDIVMQAMPISDMDAVTQGHVYGVLSLALMLQEAECNEQLRLTDEELQDARRKWNEVAQGLRKERDAVAQERDRALAYRDEAYQERDALEAENSRLHRSLEERMTAHIPGAVTVAKTEEMHGMVKVYESDAPPIIVYPPGTKVAKRGT